MKALLSFDRISDDALLAEVTRLAARERQTTADLIAALAELDARRLYLGAGCSSLFTYCTQVLHLSEHAAYGRIEAARAARRFPLILELLGAGAITLTTVCLLTPHLTGDNHQELLRAVKHKSKRDVEHLIAALRPQPDVVPTVRKLPQPKPTSPIVAPPDAAAGSCAATMPEVCAPSLPARPAAVAPLAPERYKVQFTVGKDTHDKLRRVQDLLRHSIPDGDLAAVFDRALSLLLDDLERTKLAATDRPRSARPIASHSRHVPAVVKRAVWRRDGGRCGVRRHERAMPRDRVFGVPPRRPLRSGRGDLD